MSATLSPTQLAQTLSNFFQSVRFPLFVLVTLLGYEAFLLVVVLGPVGDSGWGAFVRDFRIWCFSYDPRTGAMQWTAAVMMLTEPVFVSGILCYVWRRALRELKFGRQWRQTGPALSTGVLAAAFISGGLYLYGRPATAESELPPFPGARIRVNLPVPAFTLRDQTGATVSLEDLRGRVVLVTGIYALCTTSCPEILRQIGSALAHLSPGEREQVTVLALSLNPEYDTTELMAAVAQGRGFRHPEFRYLNGDPTTMHPLLDRLQFARLRNPDTGQIDHANLFLLVDRHGEIAYRLNSSPRHETWLVAALRDLAAEPRLGEL